MDVNPTVIQPEILESVNTNKQVKPDNNTTSKTKLDIDLHEKAEEKKTTVSFNTQNFLKDFAKKETPSNAGGAQDTSSQTTSNTIPPNVGDKQETLEGLRQQLGKTTDVEAEKMADSEFDDIADFAIELLDLGALFALRWYSKDTTDAPYKIPEEKLNKLKARLSKILRRYQAKFPLEFLFFLGLIMTYATPFRKAKENRDKVLKEQARIAKEKNTVDVPHEEIKKETRGGVKNFKKNPIRRTPGGISK